VFSTVGPGSGYKGVLRRYGLADSGPAMLFDTDPRSGNLGRLFTYHWNTIGVGRLFSNVPTGQQRKSSNLPQPGPCNAPISVFTYPYLESSQFDGIGAKVVRKILHEIWQGFSQLQPAHKAGSQGDLFRPFLHFGYFWEPVRPLYFGPNQFVRVSGVYFGYNLAIQ